YLRVLDVNLWLDVEPYRLPDAAGLHVPVLLAVRNLVVEHLRETRAVLFLIHRRIDHAHREFVRAGLHRIRNIKREWRISAFVRADGFAVDKNFAEVIDRAETYYGPLSLVELRHIKARAIPGDAHVIAQIGKLRIPRQANADAAPAL